MRSRFRLPQRIAEPGLVLCERYRTLSHLRSRWNVSLGESLPTNLVGKQYQFLNQIGKQRTCARLAPHVPSFRAGRHFLPGHIGELNDLKRGQTVSDAGRSAGSLLIGAVHCSAGRLVPSTIRTVGPAIARCSHPAGAFKRHPGAVLNTFPCSSAKLPVPEITQLIESNSCQWSSS